MEASLQQHGLTALVANARANNEKLLMAYEYDDIMDDERPQFTKQCWILSKPGSKFCVHYAWDERLDKQAGLFGTLYIDEQVLERAFLPPRSKVPEWEITGKYYRGPKGSAEIPFTFDETPLDDDVDVLDDSDRGTIRVVLHWAKSDPDMEEPYQDFSKEAADRLAAVLEAPVDPDNDRLKACVKLGKPRKSGVKENNVKVPRIDDREYTFIFRYAHPDYLTNEGVIPPKVFSTYHTQANG